jgi:hypothetical protein
MGKTICEKDIEKEYYNLAEKILNTPKATKTKVEEYHSKIKKRLDSEEIIPVPSSKHRKLHELMWIKGHEIYNHFVDFDHAIKHFCTGYVEKEKCENIKSEHIRFGVWYVKNYIPKDTQDKWAIETRLRAEKDAGKPLEEVVI